MSKQRLLLSIALFAASTVLWAIDFSAYGFTQSGTKVEDGLSYDVLLDANGSEVLLASQVVPSAERMGALRNFVESLHSWDGLAMTQIRATNDASQLRITVLPRSLVVDKVNLVPYLPGGLVFWYDKSFEYDFRIISGAYAVRLAGLFTTPRELLSSVALAVKDPVAWILQRDPQYSVRRITELLIRLTKLEEDFAAAKKEAADSLAALASSSAEALAASDAADAEALAAASTANAEALAASSAANAEALADVNASNAEALAAIAGQLAENAAADAADAEALAAAIAANDKAMQDEKARIEEKALKDDELRQAQIARLEDALMTTLNVGFFQGPKPIKPESVAWVLAKKAENPEMTQAQLVTAKTVEKIQITDREIGIVLLVKYGFYGKL
ncbi:MAG: hypothetical protein WCL50_04790 [Spirochaetota bacterium]